MNPDDSALVSAAQSGDRHALDTLLRRHYDRVYALCWRLAGNEADALDASQEALIAISRGIHHFDGRASFSTWAYRVTTNACLDELRRRKRRPRVGLTEDIGESEAADTTGAPSVAIDMVPDRLAIDTALDQMSEEFRLPVVLRDLWGFDYAEIAERLEIPPGTVRSRIARGRAQLAGLLDPRNQLPGAERPISDRNPGTSL